MKILLTIGLLFSISASETVETLWLLSGVDIHMDDMKMENEPEKESEENSEEKTKIEYFKISSLSNNFDLDDFTRSLSTSYAFTTNQYIEIFSPPPE